MKKIPLFATILMIVTLFLTSCGVGTDEDYRAILTELLPKAAEVNEMIWGEGLPTEGEIDEEATADQYLPVVSEKFTRLADIKKAVREVYSEAYAAIIEESVLSNTEYTMARYTETTEGELRMNVTTEPMNLETVFDIEGAKVKSANRYMITVEIPYTIGERAETATLLLVKENDRWLFDSPAY